VQPQAKRKEWFEDGSRAANTGAQFENVSLDCVSEVEDSGNDDSFENIGATDLAHEGKDHGSYNGQADHTRKYPKGFGNDTGGK